MGDFIILSLYLLNLLLKDATNPGWNHLGYRVVQKIYIYERLKRETNFKWFREKALEIHRVIMKHCCDHNLSSFIKKLDTSKKTTKRTNLARKQYGELGEAFSRQLFRICPFMVFELLYILFFLTDNLVSDHALNHDDLSVTLSYSKNCGTFQLLRNLSENL